MKRTNKKKYGCNHCGATLASFENLCLHENNNKKCRQIRQSSKESFEEAIHHEQESDSQSSVTSKQGNLSLPGVMIAPQPPSAYTTNPELHSYFLGLFVLTVKKLEATIPYYAEKVKSFAHSEYDAKSLATVKRELSTWIEGFFAHANAVAKGVIEEGVFNPARGRGGTTDAQRQVSAAYMLVAWKKVEDESPTTREFLKKKLEPFAKYEVLTESFQVPAGNPLANVYGPGMVWNRPGTVSTTVGGPAGPMRNAKGEYLIQTIEDWSNTNDYFHKLFLMLVKVVWKRLEHPISIDSLSPKDTKQQYDEILSWLSKSPQ